MLCSKICQLKFPTLYDAEAFVHRLNGTGIVILEEVLVHSDVDQMLGEHR